MKRRNNKGFTLVELVVVIAIIGVLAAILVPSMMGYVKKSRLKSANTNAKTAYNAMAWAITDCDCEGIVYDLSGVKVMDLDMGEAVDMPSISDSDYAEKKCQYEMYEALSENGDAAGIVCYAGVHLNGSSKASLQVQWKRTAEDLTVGQYPNPQGDINLPPVIWGEFENLS